MLHCSVLTLILTFAGFFEHTSKLVKWYSVWYHAGPEQGQQELMCNRQCRGLHSNPQGKMQFLQQQSLWLYCKRGQFAGHNSPAARPALSILPILVRSLLTEALWWKSCLEASSKSHILLLHVLGLPVRARLLFRVHAPQGKALPAPLKQDLWVLRSCMILHFSSRCSANSSHRDGQVALRCSAHPAACGGSPVHPHASFQTSGNATKQCFGGVWWGFLVAGEGATGRLL